LAVAPSSSFAILGGGVNFNDEPNLPLSTKVTESLGFLDNKDQLDPVDTGCLAAVVSKKYVIGLGKCDFGPPAKQLRLIMGDRPKDGRDQTAYVSDWFAVLRPYIAANEWIKLFEVKGNPSERYDRIIFDRSVPTIGDYIAVSIGSNAYSRLDCKVIAADEYVCPNTDANKHLQATQKLCSPSGLWA
jgi:hypothetical protein